MAEGFSQKSGRTSTKCMQGTWQQLTICGLPVRSGVGKGWGRASAQVYFDLPGKACAAKLTTASKERAKGRQTRCKSRAHTYEAAASTYMSWGTEGMGRMCQCEQPVSNLMHATQRNATRLHLPGRRTRQAAKNMEGRNVRASARATRRQGAPSNCRASHCTCISPPPLRLRRASRVTR